MGTRRFFSLALVTALWVVALGGCTATPTPTVALPTAPPTPTRRPPTAVPPTPTPAPEGDAAPETLTDALAANKPAGAPAADLLYQASEDGAETLVTYELTSFWTMTGALRDCVSSFIATAPAAFDADAELATLRAVYMIIMYDEDRNESLQPLLKVTIARNTAEGVDWTNLKRCELPDAVDELAVHPSEIESWQRMCSP